jgi:integrase
MAAEGVPVWVAMELLGHTQVSTTMNVLPTWLRS